MVMVSDESEVTALLDTRVEACEAKNIDQLMSLYSSEIAYFDVVPPEQFTGQDAVRRNFLRWFGEYEGPITLETRDLKRRGEWRCRVRAHAALGQRHDEGRVGALDTVALN